MKQQTVKRAYSPRPNARKINQEHQSDACNEIIPGRITHGDAVTLLKRLPDRSVDLVILDPPYWKVVGEIWDYKWRTEEDYRVWCKEWFEELGRVCKRSASIYLFGYIRNLVHLFKDICALGFEFRQEIIVDKGIKSIAGRKTSTYKQFPNTTEAIFFFVYDAKPAIRAFLLNAQVKAGLSAKEINERLGVKSNGGGVWSLYTGDNILAQVPTLPMWERLEEVLGCSAPEDLKGFVFNPQMGLTNVWSDIDFYDEDRIHRTQKPRKLIERIVRASSREGDLVLDPFCGSGTTVVVANRLRRNVLGFEIDKDMADKANQRVIAEAAQVELF